MQVRISSLNKKGYGLSNYEGRMLWVAGALPGELVDVEITKKKKGIRICKVVELLEPSPHRTEPISDEYLATSPYQIIDFDYENKLKEEYVLNLFSHFAIPEKYQVVAGEREYGYRNKMEFSFYQGEEKLSFAFFKRDSKMGKIAVDGSVLLPESVNKVVREIVELLNGRVSARSLKGLLIRNSFYSKKVLAVLYVKDREVKLENDIYKLITEIDNLVGFRVVYSDRRSPAFIESELIYDSGEQYLEERVGEDYFKFHYNSFFQVNPELFSIMVDELKELLYDRNRSDNSEVLLDLFGGVGTLGIVLGKGFKQVVSLEISNSSELTALENAERNGINNYKFELIDLNKSGVGIGQYSSPLLLLDPPRVGIGQKLIQEISECKNTIKNILYVSCNPETQAEDLKVLLSRNSGYEITWMRGYNFYPKTPHCENVVLLETKK